MFYARFMDDWIVLTKSKTALRKVIKRTHQIVNSQKLHLHPMKTYIGKIRHGFNFLGYYFDDKKFSLQKKPSGAFSYVLPPFTSAREQISRLGDI